MQFFLLKVVLGLAKVEAELKNYRFVARTIAGSAKIILILDSIAHIQQILSHATLFFFFIRMAPGLYF